MLLFFNRLNTTLMKHLLTISLLVLATGLLRAQSINDSLLLYLPFNGNANDASGHGNNGVVHNATLTADRHGAANGAYDFNGTDAYIEIPASPSLSRIYTANEVTIAAWINIRNWYNNWNVFAVFEQYDPATDWGSVLLEANWSSGGILFESGYNTNYIGCDYTWHFNEWHHLAVTYSTLKDSAKFYVDGSLLCVKEYQSAFTPDLTNPYVVGRSLSGPDEYSDGMIDEVRIYNRALRDNELAVLPATATGIRGQTYRPLSVYPNPAGEKLYVNADKAFREASVSVSDVVGKELIATASQAGDHLELDVRSLPPGVYLLRVRDAGQEFCQRFIKR